MKKLIIPALIAVVAITFTVVAYFAEESAAFPIMLVADVLLIIGGIVFYLKYGKK